MIKDMVLCSMEIWNIWAFRRKHFAEHFAEIILQKSFRRKHFFIYRFFVRKTNQTKHPRYIFCNLHDDQDLSWLMEETYFLRTKILKIQFWKIAQEHRVHYGTLYFQMGFLDKRIGIRIVHSLSTKRIYGIEKEVL